MAVLPLIALGATAAGTAVSTIGQIKAGNAARNVGEANALAIEQSAALNAQSAEVEAQNTLEAARIQEAQQRYADRRLLASGKAQVAAAGILLEGSPIDVLAETARQAEIDALIIRRGGTLQAESIRRQSQIDQTNARTEAAIQRQQGKNSQSASRYGAAGTILGGGYSAAQQLGAIWPKPKKT